MSTVYCDDCEAPPGVALDQLRAIRLNFRPDTAILNPSGSSQPTARAARKGRLSGVLGVPVQQSAGAVSAALRGYA
jgi:hypothetical protein